MKLTETFNRSTLANTNTKYTHNTIEDSSRTTPNFLNFQEEMRKLEIEKKNKSMKRKEKFLKYENMLQENKNKFKESETNFQENQSRLMAELRNKEKTYENLKSNVNELTTQIKELNFKLESTKSNENYLLHKRKEKYSNKIREKKIMIFNLRKKISELVQKEKEEKENYLMLTEELSNSKKDVMNITSKMESLMEFIDNLVKNSISLISSGSFTFNFSVSVTYLEFQCINKQRLSRMIYDKLNSDPTPSQTLTLNNFSNVNTVNFNTNSQSQTSDRDIFIYKMEKIYRSEMNSQNIVNLLQKMSNEILNFFKNKFETTFPFDLEQLIKSYIKLLFYDYNINIRMNYINKMTPVVENKLYSSEGFDQMQNSHMRHEIQMLAEKIEQKMTKICKLNEKLKLLRNEENFILKEESVNRKHIKSLYNEIESMKILQDEIKCDIICLEEDLACMKRRYEEEKLIRKEEKKEIKNKIGKVQYKIEKSNNKYDVQIDLVRSKFSELKFGESELNTKKNEKEVREFIKKPDEVTKKYRNYLLQPAEKDYELIYDRKSDTYRFPSPDCDDFDKPNTEMVYHRSNSFNKKDTQIHSQAINFPPKEKSIIATGFTYTKKYIPIPGNKLPIKETKPTKTKLGFDIIYTPYGNKHELLLTEKIRPLLEGTVVYKRNFYMNQINSNKVDSLQYNPIVNWKIIPPQDFNFQKYFLNIEKTVSKLCFNKIDDNSDISSKYFEIYTSSISKIVVPTITKNIIFVTQLYSKLKKKNIQDIDQYLAANVEKMIKLYYKGSKFDLVQVQIDEKLFSPEYRKLLVDSKKFIMYVYLKPDEQTRLEIVFDNYDDFKHWINGLEELLRNKEVKEIIKNKII